MGEKTKDFDDWSHDGSMNKKYSKNIFQIGLVDFKLIKNNIGIISYKAGNIFSIKNSIEYLGFNAEIIEDNTLLKNYSYLIFQVLVLLVIV